MKITGVKNITAKVFKNQKGDLIKFISKKNPSFKSFGEIYFNEIKYKKKKGWIKHKKNQCIFTVAYGEIDFKLIDDRKKSKTFGKYFSIKLSENDNTSLYIPEGFAHGFQALSDQTIVAYKATSFYKKEYEASLSFDDPNLNIEWPLKQTFISSKDLNALSIKHLE